VGHPADTDADAGVGRRGSEPAVVEDEVA